MTWDHRVIWCGVGRSNAGYGALWALRIKSETPRCALTTPPPFWARCPHTPLVCCCWQGARLIMCSLLQPRREKESGRGAAGWLPRPAGSLGPNTALMRAGGADGHTRGARDYCPGPRGARERDPRRRWGDPSRDSWSGPVPCVCSICFFFHVKMDRHSLDYLLGPAYRDMRIHAF